MSGVDADKPPAEGRVPPVPSRDEALPEDTEDEILDDDPGREKTRFDEVPKSSP
ncbi:hypothetical protein N183_31875 [Sinorhizobium sp. Sb3]|nr:hypothetical protein N183_31875 [Sinorhizobium sp. Sb3]